MRFLGILSALALTIPTTLAAKITNLQCVPFARDESGIQIYGDAYTWWGQAEGRYRRGSLPVKGAVMAFRPYGNSRLGHVAVVTKIVNKREVLLNHANWSPINGQRGQIERGVRAVDVSERNDWSRVRVWYAPIRDLGTSQFPLYGFIYPDGAKLPQSEGKNKDSKKTKHKASPEPKQALAKRERDEKAKPDSVGKADQKITRKPVSLLPEPIDAEAKGKGKAKEKPAPDRSKADIKAQKKQKEQPPKKGSGLPGVAKFLGR